MTPEGPPKYPIYSRTGLILWALAILTYETLRLPNGGASTQPNLPTSIVFGAFGLSFLVVGTVSYLSSGPGFGWTQAKRLVTSTSMGTFLTLASAPFAFYQFFEVSYTGFPLPFVTYVSILSPPGPIVDWGGLALDLSFWVAVSGLGVWGVKGLRGNSTGLGGILDGMGVAALLTFATYPAYGFLGLFGVFNFLGQVLGSAIVLILLIFPLPGLAAGLAAYAKGRRTPAVSTMIFSVVFFLLLISSLLMR